MRSALGRIVSSVAVGALVASCGGRPVNPFTKRDTAVGASESAAGGGAGPTTPADPGAPSPTTPAPGGGEPTGTTPVGHGESPAIGPDGGPHGDTSYMPVDAAVPFAEMRAKLVAEKADAEARQKAELEQRYDLTDHPLAATQFRGKPIQGGVRAKLPDGQTWDGLAAMTAAAIREQGLMPRGFLPLPHPKQVEGGQVIPHFHIEEIKRQEGRDLQRFDIDFDIPDQFLPEFPAPIFLTSRPDLGDVSGGQLVTIKNYFSLFNGILTPRELDGLRLLVTPFAQQQFNLTDDRRVDEPSLGISCFDCHANGHTNAATHLDPNTRPQEVRRRLDVPSLRGVNIQRLFGSQRALKTIEDFTEFEQLGAYFDGDQVIAAKKGFNKLDRALQVAHMAEVQNILDFPPAPRLGIDGKLIPALASAAELRGQDVFFGKGDCASCHTPPFYTDNLMHDLRVERFYKPQMLNGKLATAEGPIKTFPLRGMKDSPPYLHDGRLLTIEDTVEFFNLVLERHLTTDEKADLTAFLLTL
jgi:cytochrome c peroxidase